MMYAILFLCLRQINSVGNLRSFEEGEMSWINVNSLSEMNKEKLVSDFPDRFQMFTDDSISELFYQKDNNYKLTIK